MWPDSWFYTLLFVYYPLVQMLSDNLGICCYCCLLICLWQGLAQVALKFMVLLPQPLKWLEVQVWPTTVSDVRVQALDLTYSLLFPRYFPVHKTLFFVGWGFYFSIYLKKNSIYRLKPRVMILIILCIYSSQPLDKGEFPCTLWQQMVSLITKNQVLLWVKDMTSLVKGF